MESSNESSLVWGAMMTEFLQFLQSATGMILVASLLLVVLASWMMQRPTFAWTDFIYQFPLVGKLRRLSRDYSETTPGQWLNSEARLCHDYAQHLTGLSPDEFENHSEYLRKCYDSGRKPLPPLIIAVLVFLVVLEGLGFSYLLSTWMALEGSENTRQLLTFAIVTVLSAVLVWTMHAAGHQLYRTRLLRSCFQESKAANLDKRLDRPKARSFTSQIISLNQDQSEDDDQPSFVQCANRVAANPSDTGSYAWLWIAGIFILAIAVLSTILRIETLHGDPLAVAGATTNNQILAREYAALSSFWILAAIFVVTQFVGMGVGFRYGFAGRESNIAYRTTNGAPNYESYYRPIAERMHIADARLSALHGMMEARHTGSIDWDRDFFNFIEDERKRGVCDLHSPKEVQEARQRRAAQRTAAIKQRRGMNGAAAPVNVAVPPGTTADVPPVPRSGEEGEGVLQ